MDPRGLESGVIVWDPVGSGKSSVGHVSAYVNGTAYSFGPDGMSIKPQSKFLSRNGFRNGFGFGFNLSASEERKLSQCLSRFQGDYSWINNSCTDPLERCLNEIGHSVGDSYMPQSLLRSIFENKKLWSHAEFYPASRPGRGWNAPWAK